MDASRERRSSASGALSETMSGTKSATRASTRSGAGASARKPSPTTSTARRALGERVVRANGTSSSSASRRGVPAGKLLSIPEKRERGMLADDRIDDAEERTARAARPRRPRPTTEAALAAVRALDAAPAFPYGPEASSSSPPPSRPSSLVSSDHHPGSASLVSQPRLLEIERAMRATLRGLHTVTKDAKSHLADAFALVADDDDDARKSSSSPPRRVSWKAFGAAWAYLGLGDALDASDPNEPLTEPECRAWCRLIEPAADDALAWRRRNPRRSEDDDDDDDEDASIDVRLFCDRVLRGAARHAAKTRARTHRGYPCSDADFAGTAIAYPRCRRPVRAPTWFVAAHADRSVLEPDARLELEHVHGYDGAACKASNVFFVGGVGGTGGEEDAATTRDEETKKISRVAYYAAAVGIVQDLATGAQTHFLGHTKDITCMDVLRDAEVALRGATYPPGTLAATGQTRPGAEEMDDAFRDDDDAGASSRPFVAIWDVRTGEEVKRVRLDAGMRSVAAVAFSPDGATLVTVGCDDAHTVQIWDWRAENAGEDARRDAGEDDDASRTSSRRGRAKPPPVGFGDDPIGSRGLGPAASRSERSTRARGGEGSKPIIGLAGQGAGFKERPGHGVFGVRWDRHSRTVERFCTWGKKHVKLWRRAATTGDPLGGAWSSETMRFGAFGVDDVGSCEFLKPPASDPGGEGAIVTGMPNGTLLVWRDGRAVRRIKAHRRGPRTIQPDGAVAWGGGVAALRLRDDDETLLTGGADGVVARFDASGGDVGDPVTDPLVLAHPNGSGIATRPSPVRALDCVPGSDVIVAGTANCDVFRVALAPEREGASLVAGGHAATCRATCWHPARADRFFTCAEDGDVAAWDADERRAVRVVNVGFAATAIAVTHRPIEQAYFIHSDDEAEDGRAEEAEDVPLVGSHHVAVGGANGELVVLDDRTLRVVSARMGPTRGGPRLGRDPRRGASVEDLKYSPDDASLAASTRDGAVVTLAVGGNFEVPRSTPYGSRLVFAGHGAAAAKHLDWTSDGSCLGSSGADYELLHWDPRDGSRTDRATRDLRWATWTRPLGFPAMGIWAPESDGTDVNAVDRSPDGRYLVTADDRGEVKLFANPCCVEGAGFRSARGHASHVLSARFSADGRRVATAGGRDRCAFQYRLVRDDAPEPRPETPEKRWLPLDARGKSYGFRTPEPGEISEGEEEATATATEKKGGEAGAADARDAETERLSDAATVDAETVDAETNDAETNDAETNDAAPPSPGEDEEVAEGEEVALETFDAETIETIDASPPSPGEASASDAETVEEEDVAKAVAVAPEATTPPPGENATPPPESAEASAPPESAEASAPPESAEANAPPSPPSDVAEDLGLSSPVAAKDPDDVEEGSDQGYGDDFER